MLGADRGREPGGEGQHPRDPAAGQVGRVVPAAHPVGGEPAEDARHEGVARADRVDDLDGDGGFGHRLTAAGVTFEQYPSGAIKTNEKGVAELGDVKGAWFKDPDGNTLAIANP